MMRRGRTQGTTLADFYASAQAWAYGICQRVTSGHNWPIAATALTVAMCLLMAFPSYQDFRADPDKAGKTWKAVLLKGKDLGWNVLEAFGPSTNAARVNFRLTGPVLVKTLKLGVPGLVTVLALAGAFLLGICVWLAGKICGDKAIGLLAGIGVAATWAGATAFCELRGVFDGLALCFLMSALAFQNPVVIAIFVFLAAWTDERALVNFPLLLVSMWVLHGDSAEGQASGRARLKSIAGAVSGFTIHLLSRAAYARWFGIPHRFDGNGIEVLMNQINNIPMGIWSGLEGGWIIICSAAYLAWVQGRRIWLAMFLASISLVLVVSFAVVDISRTTAFLLPAFFAGLAVLRASEEAFTVRRIVFLSTLVSVLWPMYYVGGKSTIWWVYPLPVQLIRIAMGR